MNRRVFFVACIILLMGISIKLITNTGIWPIDNGTLNLNNKEFRENQVVKLNGFWEFYWDQLLTPADFQASVMPEMDSLVKVPGSWSDQAAGEKAYPAHGVGTYRMVIHYPSAIKDPGLILKTVSGAYKLYANGQLITGVGTVSKDSTLFVPEYRTNTVALPAVTGNPDSAVTGNPDSAVTGEMSQMEIIIQVANFDYSRGGLRDPIKFGSLGEMVHQQTVLLLVQMLFIGVIGGLGIYFLMIYGFNRVNRGSFTNLIFGFFCLLVAMRAFFWGEFPVLVFFPELSTSLILAGNYITLYNTTPLMLLYVASIYQKDTSKTLLGLVILPLILSNSLLLISAEMKAIFNGVVYFFIILALLYAMVILATAVVRKREHAMLHMISIGLFIFAYISDMLVYMGLSTVNTSYLQLFGNIFVIIAMSIIQSGREAGIDRQQILYNKVLIEADRLKNEVTAAEMAFLQAQIKPHFLYNALGAIANICEKDGKKAGELIIDLAIYLRTNLEFNRLNKMSTLENELELVDRYFNIEQARFGEKIQLRKEIDVELNFSIPVFVLQPLVENSVRHGISKRYEGGTVTVRGSYTAVGARFEVEDDGIGIREGQTLKQGQVLVQTSSEAEPGIALLNIQKRLMGLYGTGLEITRMTGGGTRVEFIIPEREVHHD